MHGTLLLNLHITTGSGRLPSSGLDFSGTIKLEIFHNVFFDGKIKIWELLKLGKSGRIFHIWSCQSREMEGDTSRIPKWSTAERRTTHRFDTVKKEYKNHAVGKRWELVGWKGRRGISTLAMDKNHISSLERERPYFFLGFDLPVWSSSSLPAISLLQLFL